MLAWGPQIGEEANFHYNYHATQVLHVVGGKHWTTWHGPLRDYLVAAQNRDPRDHAFRSWFVAADPGSSPGGRLYCTAVAALTLQVICSWVAELNDWLDGPRDVAALTLQVICSSPDP